MVFESMIHLLNSFQFALMLTLQSLSVVTFLRYLPVFQVNHTLQYILTDNSMTLEKKFPMCFFLEGGEIKNRKT